MNTQTHRKMRNISYILLAEWLFLLIGLFIGIVMVETNHLFDIQIISRMNSRLINHLLRTRVPGALGFLISVLYSFSLIHLYLVSLTVLFVFVYISYFCMFQVLMVNEYIKEFILTYTKHETRLELSYDEDFQRDMSKQMKFIAETIWVYSR